VSQRQPQGTAPHPLPQWRERAEILDQQAAQHAERTVVRERTERITDTTRLVDDARRRFDHQLQDPDLSLTASGFVDPVKLEQLLEGGPLSER
jgi:hypothetical protein